MSFPSILVVDDEPDNFDVIEAFLGDHDYQLHYASNGQEALKSLHIFQPDVILLDVMMPEVDGITACRKIKAQPEWQSVPIIMVTALSDKEDLARCIQAGADDFISKPVNSTELRARVQSMLRIRKQYQSIQELLSLQENTVNVLQGSLDELRGNLAMGLPHELNTPLNGIFGVLGILIEDHEDMDHEEIAELLQLAKTSTMRLERVSRRYLSYVQLVRESNLRSTEGLSTGGNLIAPTAQQVTDVVTSDFMTDLAKSQASEAGRMADLSYQFTDSEIAIQPSHVRMIIEELLNNAFKFSQAGTPVEISAQLLDESLYLLVSDRGRGMTPTQIEQIGAFVQFERRNYEQQGLGLGLAIVQKIVERYQGELLIHSAINDKTTVTVRLPVPVSA